ncbi:type II toxin-antitoxin system RelE/ParE family toxin (plasmid) [Arsenophonus sp. aPb]|uniref:type II toxin-antitoxin system RelE family toxin n=1 Tax=Arsenophonus sp. aPb TaxID=3041619 RepID=UPI002469A3F5|nr:type II toxin-antitoxin system RelE/ParE family toxin [Arsenophonus sp. aPb]WGL99818.1 type II toxin-antitoxin system RelE/ParE family toxin [Arsenophonus sp. aPb]
MNYELQFEKRALKEWKKLPQPIKEQFKKKLNERLQNPHIISAKLSGSINRYKIKLRSSGYRLVYEVDDEKITVYVIAVGKRERSEVYILAKDRNIFN